MAGAGVLPALIAERAHTQGWRVVAFAFAGAAGLGGAAARVVPS
ncbi:MAG: hypothetical protein ACRDGH_17110, partial [Candidatus Limnocylindria bacterium]